MSTVYKQVRIDSLDPFQVVLQAAGRHSSEVLHTARDADNATIAFHLARQRLTRDQVAGDLLLLVQQEEEPRTLLREPLGEARPRRRPWAAQRSIIRSASRRTYARHAREAAVAG
jgi:hypothetical protein